VNARSGPVAQPPCDRAGTVPGTARPRRSSERSSGAGPVPPFSQPGFIALSAAWPLHSYLELGALPSAVPCTRLSTRHLLREWGLSELTEVTELLVSELTTNAVATTVQRRLDSPIRWRLSSNHTQVLIEVWDADATPPPVPTTEPPALDAVSGRGLFLVNTLSARWSWYAVPTVRGKVVWAEVGS
jgi:anti-sigma regulatory factor (Ser/Thr protein kinase)